MMTVRRPGGGETPINSAVRFCSRRIGLFRRAGVRENYRPKRRREQAHEMQLMKWLGGKHLLAPEIIRALPEHRHCVEVFLGGGSVFWRKERSKEETINDLDGRVTNLLRIAQRHPDALLDELRHLAYSRRLFREHVAQPGVTNVERAGRFWFVLHAAFSTRLVGRPSWSTRALRFGQDKMRGVIERAHERLCSAAPITSASRTRCGTRKRAGSSATTTILSSGRFTGDSRFGASR